MKSHQFPIEFTTLTPAQLDQLHSWLDEFSYRIVREKLQSEFAVTISANKLARYNQRRELTDELNDEESFQLGTKEFYDLLNGNPAPYDEATLLLISKRVFEILLTTRGDKMTVTKLNLLHRLATCKTQLDFTRRRLAIKEHQLGITSSAPESNTTSSTLSAEETKPAPVPPCTSQPAEPPRPTPLHYPSPLDSIITPRAPARVNPDELTALGELLADFKPAHPFQTKYPIAA